MTLEIGLPAGVEAELLNDDTLERRGDSLRIFLGDAYAGETRTLVLKLNLPALASGQDIRLPLTLRYADVQQRQSVTVQGQAIHFTPAHEQACQSQNVNEQVLREAGRMEAERAKMEALKREYQGDVAEAKVTLHKAKAILGQAMPAPMAQAFSAELDDLEEEMEKGLTEQVRKLKHYATYQIHRSRKDYKK